MLCGRKILFRVITLLLTLSIFPIYGLNRAVLLELPFSFKAEPGSIKYPDNRFLGSYARGDFKTIAKNPYPSKGHEEEQFVYLRSLYHIESWKRLAELSPNFPEQSPLYPYILFYRIRALAQLKKYNAGLELYQKNTAALSAVPFQDEVSDLLEFLNAGLLREKDSKNPGRYHYYRYYITGEVNSYLQSVLQKDEKSIKGLSSVNYRRYVPVKFYSQVIDDFEKLNPWVAIDMHIKAKAHHKAGLLYFAQKKYQKAISLLDRKSVEYSICLAARNQIDSKQFKKLLTEKFEQAYPALLQGAFGSGNYDRLYEILSIKYKEGYLRPIVLEYLTREKYEPALSVLEKFSRMNQSPEEKVFTHFWLGFLKLHIRNSKDGIENYKFIASNYPFSFYGFNALLLLDKEARKDVVDEWAVISQSALKKNHEYFRELKEKKLNPDKDLGLFFLRINESVKGFDLLKKNLGSLDVYYLELVKYFKSINRPDLSIYFSYFLYKKITDNYSHMLIFPDLARELLPVYFQDELQRVLKYYPQLSYLTMLAMMRQESMFFQHAVSSAGALGLMQLMPATARPIITNLYKKKQIKTKYLLDPYTNIQAGCTFYNWLFSEYYKDMPEPYREILSIASYNAGPTRIVKKYKSFKTILHPYLFIESIPLDETRDYVKRVLLYKELYKYLYSKS